jgi:hypothetical protein
VLQEAAVIGRWLIGALAIAMIMDAPSMGAQGQRPLAPPPADSGLRVAPFFDGWYQNPDGTFTLSFGYSNLNREEVEIPVGPDNAVTPKEYDGRQPTAFLPGVPDATDAAAAGRRQRERGVFTITVPAGFSSDVVWTLRYRGQTYSVPGRAKNTAYQLDWPMAMGSVPPLLRFTEGGPAGRGPTGIQASPVQTAVSKPLSLAVWVTDDSVREKEPVTVAVKRERPAMNVNWFKHSGPGPVVFGTPRTPFAQLAGTANTSVTFKEPGEYVLRVRVDNFGRLDTSPGNQCCWTNGYVKVTVTP